MIFISQSQDAFFHIHSTNRQIGSSYFRNIQKQSRITPHAFTNTHSRARSPSCTLVLTHAQKLHYIAPQWSPRGIHLCFLFSFF
uniref:Uncharacterized protein n=1 Tax=Anguilla anguilla TaxID=7936 RepID=A0A0E9VVG5_ANGAN